MIEDRFEILNDYLDGTLRGEERAALERRLATDAELATELEELRALLAAAAELPREATPRRDLWPGIERRLDRAKVVRIRFPRAGTLWRAAALAAAAALVTFVLTRPGGDTGRKTPESVAVAPGERAESPLDRADLEYASASRDVLDRLENDRELDPETVALIRRNLELIDQAVREIRQALDASPEDARLQHRLTAEYQRRGEVLRQAADLTHSI